MYAQSLVEHGALTTGLPSAFQQLTWVIRDWVAHTSPMTWLVVGAVLLVGFMLRRR